MLIHTPATGPEGLGKRPCQSVNTAGTPTQSSTTSPSISSPTLPTKSPSPSFLPYRPLSLSSVKDEENNHTFTVWDAAPTWRTPAPTSPSSRPQPRIGEDRRRHPWLRQKGRVSRLMETKISTSSSAKDNFGRNSSSPMSRGRSSAHIFSQQLPAARPRQEATARRSGR